MSSSASASSASPPDIHLMIPFVVTIRHPDVLPDTVLPWFRKCAGFQDFYLYGEACAAIFSNMAYAILAVRSLRSNQYEGVDSFPILAWHVHPLKLEFVRLNLLPTFNKIVRAHTKSTNDVDTKLQTATNTIYLEGPAISGRNDEELARCLAMHHDVHRLVTEISLQRVECQEVREQHTQVLQLKIKQILAQRARLVQSMGIHAVGDEDATASNVMFRTTVKDQGILITFCGMLREVRACVDRLRNIRPLCPQQKHVAIRNGDWETLCRFNVFQKNNAARLELEEKHAVHFKPDNTSVLVCAVTASDLERGERAFLEYLSTIRPKALKALKASSAYM